LFSFPALETIADFASFVRKTSAFSMSLYIIIFWTLPACISLKKPSSSIDFAASPPRKLEPKNSKRATIAIGKNQLNPLLFI